ncbi:sugar phosphate isomerase/epimerase [Candidatus Woesearchaeota archaeon]|nr:sugar phosphate isomerase/epimerase [Candidatus Woesearchaeota archaeon]
MAEGETVVERHLGNIVEKCSYNQGNDLVNTCYDFSNITSIATPNSCYVIFDNKGNVIYPIKSEVKTGSRQVKILPTRKIRLNIDFDKEFEDLKGQQVHLIMPRQREMYMIEHEILRNFLGEYDVNVGLVHGPGTDIFHPDFIGAVAFIKGNYGVDTITLHPSEGDYTNAKTLFEQEQEAITRLGVKLAYENMEANDRWLSYPEQITDMNLPFIGLTLDLSHLPANTDIVALVDRVFGKLDVVHLSNQGAGKTHIPYRQGTMNVHGFLYALKANGYKGYIVLEYGQGHHEQREDDLKRVQDFFS